MIKKINQINFKSSSLKIIVVVIFSALFPINNFSQDKGKGLKIWFNKPAERWDDALPVGNGRLGAMVFGGIESERIQLNEESVWTGADMDYHNPEAPLYLDSVRQLLFEGKYIEAEELSQQKIMGTKHGNPESGTYQTLGDLLLDFV